MDWNKIEKEYPKAFKLWKDGQFYYRTQQYFRLIYDFFDKQGIYVNVMKDWDFADFDSMGINVKGFALEIVYQNMEYCFDDDVDFADSRSKAEIKAFTKAFKILEDKLNKDLIWKMNILEQ